MNEVYRLIKSVDIGPALSSLGRLQFIGVGYTPDKYRCDVVQREKFSPELIDLLDSLALGGTTARALLRKLGPRQSIPPHIDKWMPQEADWRRFQLPLITDPKIVMRWPDDDVSVHLAAGNLYEVSYSRLHEVVNEADIDRIHLQIDQVDATI